MDEHVIQTYLPPYVVSSQQIDRAIELMREGLQLLQAQNKENPS